MRQIFVNLPVKDLERSKNFFGSLGFSFLVIEKDASYAMLLTEPFFKTFTPRPVIDAKKATEVLFAFRARAKTRSTRWSLRPRKPEAKRCGSRRTTASCTSMPSRTRTGISGSSST
jgi:hypothetical protein